MFEQAVARSLEVGAFARMPVAILRVKDAVEVQVKERQAQPFDFSV
jgi:hypothetical protein